MTSAELSQRLDLTILKPEALAGEVHRVATAAMHGGCRAVVAAPVWTQRLATMLQGSGVRVVSVVGYPFGASKSTVKAIEATSTLKDGADEIEVVPHLASILSFDLDATRAELMEIVRAARMTRREATVRAVVETGLLMRLDGERRERTMQLACRAARESGCDGVTTGTGCHDAPGATAAEAVAALRNFAESLTIKAAVADHIASARAAVEAGADLVGTTVVEV